MSTVFEGLNHHWASAMRKAQENARDQSDHQEEAGLMTEVKGRVLTYSRHFRQAQVWDSKSKGS